MDLIDFVWGIILIVLGLITGIHINPFNLKYEEMPKPGKTIEKKKKVPKFFDL